MIGVLKTGFTRIGRALSVRLLHAWRPGLGKFDEQNLMSAGGLIPVLALAEQTGLPELLEEQVRFVDERVASGAANPVGKVTAILAGLLTGADCIDDLDVIGSGGMKRVFGGVYAAATLGIFLREFTHGHVRQLHAVLTRHPPRCWPASPTWRSSMSTRCCARCMGCMASTSKERRTATPRSPAGRCSAKDSHRWR